MQYPARKFYLSGVYNLGKLTRLLVVGPDKYFTLAHLGRLCRYIQIVANGIFTVVNDLASDTVQRAVIELEPLFDQSVLQAFQRVVPQVVRYAQDVGGVTILDLAIRQAGQ